MQQELGLQVNKQLLVVLWLRRQLDDETNHSDDKSVDQLTAKDLYLQLTTEAIDEKRCKQ